MILADIPRVPCPRWNSYEQPVGHKRPGCEERAGDNFAELPIYKEKNCLSIKIKRRTKTTPFDQARLYYVSSTPMGADGHMSPQANKTYDKDTDKLSFICAFIILAKKKKKYSYYELLLWT